MKKITKYFTHDYTDDTTVEYVVTGLYSMLNCSFTSEDPDYGTDTIHYTADPVASMEQMAYEMKTEISHYLDLKENGRPAELEYVYGAYSNTTLYAVESALSEITKDFNPDKRYMTVADASKMVANALLADRKKEFAFCESDPIEAKTNPMNHRDDGGWHGIKRIDGFFENETDEFIVAIGHWGGGNVGFGYADRECEPEDYVTAVRKAICNATGLTGSDYIYIELEEKKEEK